MTTKTKAEGFNPPPMVRKAPKVDEFLLVISLPDKCWDENGYFKKGDEVAELYDDLKWITRENIINELLKKKIKWIDRSGGNVWFEFPSKLKYSKNDISEFVARSCLACNFVDGWRNSIYPLEEISIGFPSSPLPEKAGSAWNNLQSLSEILKIREEGN